MTRLTMTTLDGPEKAIDLGAVEHLRRQLQGPLLHPGDDGYDDARHIWNGMIDRQPALIVRCTDTADVVTAVNFARKHDLLVSVRGGGHGVAGSALCDGGFMIDLSLMRAVYVEPKARTARVQGGATWGDLDHAMQAFGLATPGGIISTTGVAGLTLGGGFGWLSRLYGLAADNLLSVDVVTAAGEPVTANEHQNADLFWGIRGGGGNFGIVTSFLFKLHDVGPSVLFGPTVYRYEDAPGVLRHYRAFARHAPNACSVYVDFLTAPPFPFLPEDVHGTRILSVIQCYAGDLEEGEAVLRPLRAYGDPIADVVSSMPYTVAQSISDGLYEKGARNYWKSHNFIDLPDGALDVLVEYAGTLPTPQSDILIHQVGGAINDVAPSATAYPHRDTSFVVTPGARWEDPTRDEACIAWVRACHEALAAYAAGGTYANFISEREGRERDAYGPNYERLVTIKNKYDPINLFRLNQNIRPSAEVAA